MAMNGLPALNHVLETGSNEIHIDPALGQRAKLPIDRMLEFAAKYGIPSFKGAAAVDSGKTGGIGPA
jgi:quinolinate synthase